MNFRLFLISAFGLFSLSLGMAAPALAADSPKTIVCNQVNQFDNSCSGSGESRIVGPNGLITKIVQAMVFLVGAVAVLVIVIAGFRYVVSGGSPDSTKGAKDMLIYAVVGLIVALGAQAIVSLVLAKI